MSDALDDTGYPMTILEELSALKIGKPAGFGPREQSGDGLTDAEFKSRVDQLDDMAYRRFEMDREWNYFEYQPLMQGPRQNPSRGWRVE